MNVIINRISEHCVVCRLAATWPKHQSGIIWDFYDAGIFVVSSFSSKHAYYVGTDPLLTSWNIILNFPFKFIFYLLTYTLWFGLLEISALLFIHFLPEFHIVSLITHSFTSKLILGKILARPLFHFNLR
jgi:hypothetical protein